MLSREENELITRVGAGVSRRTGAEAGLIAHGARIVGAVVRLLAGQRRLRRCAEVLAADVVAVLAPDDQEYAQEEEHALHSL